MTHFFPVRRDRCTYIALESNSYVRYPIETRDRRAAAFIFRVIVLCLLVKSYTGRTRDSRETSSDTVERMISK